MKAFRFPLERVLSWRQAQLNVEELGLRRLNAELQTVVQEFEACHTRRANAQSSLLIGSSPAGTSTALMIRPHVQVMGTDLRDLEQVGIWAARRERELLKKAEGIRVMIVKQTRALTEARMRVRLLENLKQRRQEDWTAEENRELEELAGESAVATWRRMHNPVRAG
jgi:hypothetical protein